MQGFTGLVAGPGVVMLAQTSIDLAAIGQVHAADRRVMTNFVVEAGQFLRVVFKSTHSISIT